eukprot:1065078-Ditylum_brightwellii.AAC.1
MPAYNESQRTGPPEEAYPDADYFTSPTRIFKLIQQRRWDDAISHLRQAPDEAKRWVVRKYDKEVTMRRLPIHEACIRGPTVSVVVALIDANRHGVKEQDLNGRLPLHHACAKGATPDVVLKLVYAYPNSIDAQDKYGKTALDCVKESINPSERLMKLLQKRPSHFMNMSPELQVDEDQYNRKSRGLESPARNSRGYSNSQPGSFESPRPRGFESPKPRYSSDRHSMDEAARHKQMITEATISGLENELHKVNKMLEEKTKSEEDLQNSLQQLRLQKEDETKTLQDEVAKEKAFRNADATAFNEEKMIIKQKVEGIEKESKDKSEEITLLKTLLEKSQGGASSAQIDLIQEKEKVKDLLDKVSLLESEASTLRSEVVSTKENASIAGDEQQQIIQGLEDKLAEFVELMADAEASLLEKGKQVKVANAEIEATKESMMTVEAEKQQEIDDLHSHLEELEDVIADLEQRLEESEKYRNLELTDTRDDLSRAEDDVVQLEKFLNDEKEN